jgi:hypothetical protein
VSRRLSKRQIIEWIEGQPDNEIELRFVITDRDNAPSIWHVDRDLAPGWILALTRGQLRRVSNFRTGEVLLDETLEHERAGFLAVWEAQGRTAARILAEVAEQEARA